MAGSVLVIGSRIADNFAADMPGGVIRAYDVITGELRWVFDPRNPDPNYMLKEGEVYKRSSANAWAALSYDPEMNTVFLPMGSSSVDVWGGNRQPLDHKYNSSVLALDATTGKENGFIKPYIMIYGILIYRCNRVLLTSYEGRNQSACGGDWNKIRSVLCS